MKDNLKFTLGLVFVSLLGMGCKKTVLDPLPKPSSEQNGIKLQATVKVRAVGFQVEQDDSGILSLKNTPVNTKQNIIITDGIDRTKTAKVLRIDIAPGDLKKIDPEGFDIQHNQTTTRRDVQNVMTFRRTTSFKSCKTEVFALSRALLPEEIEGLKKQNMTRETFRTYCQDPNTQITLLGSAVATDAIKALENSIKTTERAIERAKIAKQKTEEKFAAGNATKNSLSSAEDNLTSLEKKLQNLKEELLNHQVH